MGRGGKKGTVTPQELNPSPRLKRGPKMGKRRKMKRKKKKTDVEELKKEVVLVRTPRCRPQPGPALPAGTSSQARPVPLPQVLPPRPGNDPGHRLSTNDSTVPSGRSQINPGRAEHQVLRGPDDGERRRPLGGWRVSVPPLPLGASISRAMLLPTLHPGTSPSNTPKSSG